MSAATASPPPSRTARYLTLAIVALHAALLLAMLPDYFADNDLGYHISLGRQYGEHATYFWDHLNWAPTGRPNLQGPLLHFSIGILGRILGGHGDSYVLAFSLLAVLQWSVAVFTAYFFAKRYGGDWAALIAIALLTGSAWSAGSFFVGVPSGWIFLLTPWAIHFFLNERYILSALFTTAVVYVHLGGISVAPFGILLAALATRRWKGLLITGALTTVLSSVYLYHFLSNIHWYNGTRGHVAGSYATLTYLLAVPGLLWLLHSPKQNLFLLIWPLAPLAWLFQDNLRFMLQSTVAASVIAGLFVAWALSHLSNRLRTALAAALVLLATLFPLSIPALPIEFLWATGKGFPRELDWNEARQLAAAMDRAQLNHRIVHSYYDSLSGAMAVYSPLEQEFGHWGEVKPPVNPAANISAGEKLYVLPLPPSDPTLAHFQSLNWIANHGGSPRTTLVTLTQRPPLDAAAREASAIIHRECAWLAANAVNNRMPDPKNLFHPETISEFRRRMTTQRNHAGAIELATLVYAYASEPDNPQRARGLRGMVRGWGSIANFLGDETAMDYLSQPRFQRFLNNATQFGQRAQGLTGPPSAVDDFFSHAAALFDDFFQQDNNRPSAAPNKPR